MPDVRIDRELCIGSENCLRYAPRTFETDAEGKATLKPEPRDPDEVIAIAVSSCPVGALSIADGDEDAAPDQRGWEPDPRCPGRSRVRRRRAHKARD